MAMDGVYTKLLGVAKSYTSRRRIISEDTNVNNDLHLYGDDAWEFLQELHEGFGLSFDEFEFTKYFYTEEDISVLPYVIAVLLLPKKPPLSIRHLLSVIKRNQWFEPELR